MNERVGLTHLIANSDQDHPPDWQMRIDALDLATDSLSVTLTLSTTAQLYLLCILYFCKYFTSNTQTCCDILDSVADLSPVALAQLYFWAPPYLAPNGYPFTTLTTAWSQNLQCLIHLNPLNATVFRSTHKNSNSDHKIFNVWSIFEPIWIHLNPLNPATVF